jgi:hypothetical protein
MRPGDARALPPPTACPRSFGTPDTPIQKERTNLYRIASSYLRRLAGVGLERRLAVLIAVVGAVASPVVARASGLPVDVNLGLGRSPYQSLLASGSVAAALQPAPIGIWRP